MEAQLGIQRFDLGQGRRTLNLNVGAISVKVLETPVRFITEREWFLVKRARGSYVRMWGSHLVASVAEDEFDGRRANSPYNTYHYLAEISRKGRVTKYLTMRKVGMARQPPSSGKDLIPPLPQDITFWQVRDKRTGGALPLADVIRHSFCDGKFGSPEVDAMHQVCAISRTGKYTPGPTGDHGTDRESTAIAFALIQIAASDRDDHALWICQLRREWQEKVLSISDIDGRPVRLDFTETSWTLSLPHGKQVILDNSNPEIRQLKLTSPGYWLDNHGAANVLKVLAEEQKLTISDIQVAYQQSGLSNNSLPDFLPKAIDMLVQPRLFKYLVDLINTPGMVNRRLAGEELRARLIHEASDGPFSCTLIPSDWRQSAVRLLTIAKNKYE